MKKSRFFYLDPACNPGKIARLDALQVVYGEYVQTCCAAMLAARRMNLQKSELQQVFPASDQLTSQIVKNARQHAVQIISSWVSSLYQRKLKGHIGRLFREQAIDEQTRHALYTVGRYLRDKPKGIVTQETLDQFWTMVLDPNVSGEPPRVSSRLPVRMSEMTGHLEESEEASLTGWWFSCSSLVARKTISIPLARNPFIKSTDQTRHGVSARRDRRGRWRFEVVETREWELPEAIPDRVVGVDVGLRVIAASSQGDLLGQAFKPGFDKLHGRIQAIKANRQRQGLLENSPRLGRLEERLTGQIKSIVGRASNQLVAAHPGATFVIEDLDLRGCRGSKRFAYRALATALSRKAPVELVNPAYTSQTCPQCGHVERGNRSGLDFTCRACGRCLHADLVGALNLLGRSKTKQGMGALAIQLTDRPALVREKLRRLYWARRNPGQDCPASFLREPQPRGRRLTTRRGANPLTYSRELGDVLKCFHTSVHS